MKTIVIALAAATALSAGAASAQPHYGARHDGGRWMSINERQARLDHRIDRGIENGQLNRREAIRLRREFQRIAYLENRYRANGLSGWERADLDRRFDALSAQIRYERRDGDRYGYNNYPRY
ncbi:hypothetical protein [uncultured Phenylobacterium sp.]|uniref:hypothetical protein n=1 Tax=uncultured Phenylobacterium sp. TaxID=349273 RepID=UPI0025F566FD|nr:hypothetical protein [uncultured Phenylobacterium sp.]